MNKFLTTPQLAERWHMSQGTLENWRTQGKGPAYVKLSPNKPGKVLYKLEDVEAFENDNFRANNNGRERD